MGKSRMGIVAVAVALLGGIPLPRRKRREMVQDLDMTLQEKEAAKERELARLRLEMGPPAEAATTEGPQAAVAPARVPKLFQNEQGELISAEEYQGQLNAAREREAEARLRRAIASLRAPRRPLPALSPPKAQAWGESRRSRRRCRHKALHG